MTKKILYLMHVNWDSIKQRPHFIAEGLSKFFELNVICQKSIFLKSHHSSKKENIVKINHIFEIPLCRTKYIYPIYKFLQMMYIQYLLKKYNPNYIWITFPSLYDYIPSDNQRKIIYDCMDNATAFDLKENYKSNVRELEKKLVKDASLIFTSANKLAQILNNLYNCNDKLFLIRNAFAGKILKTNEYQPNTKKSYKIGYVGTVSSWFDFEIIEYTLKNFDNIEYHIIGPVESRILKTRSNNRIKFYGPVEHSDLYDYTHEFDCMIMPFKLNDLILSVDPVKLYEYINYNKPIISVFYNEIESFSPFVYFYSTKKDIIQLLHNMDKSGFKKKYSETQRVNFLRKNSWKNRILKIVEHINKMEG